ncbi:DNA-directed RNA polymerase subunit delta [Paenibacillus sp. NPDC057967]|uniref:DNA-directed RNA polymerase subunit delta n=1 Tax=Paenibacillus sp. NPDC057967 TaxID=3346293 RepID=UPI0036DCB8F7
MSGSNYTLKLDPERIKEMPMVDLAFEVLKAANTPYYYRDLMMEIAKIRGLSEEGINQFIAQVYTEINIDGRFACVGSNMWGLKRWYPVERSEDPVGNAKRTRIINDDDDLEDEDPFADEEDSYAAEDEDYDAYDEDSEDFDESEEEAEVDEDVEIEDEDLDEEVEDEELDAEEEEEEDSFDEEEAGEDR